MMRHYATFYDIDKPLVLQVDASTGLGACLLQDNKPISYASRSLISSEENYANIERELLAIVYACERFHQYTYGYNVIVHTDHKPLESILKRSLAKAPPRLQRLLLRLQKYTVIFLGHIWGRIWAPFPMRISFKLTKNSQLNEKKFPNFEK